MLTAICLLLPPLLMIIIRKKITEDSEKNEQNTIKEIKSYLVALLLFTTASFFILSTVFQHKGSFIGAIEQYSDFTLHYLIMAITLAILIPFAEQALFIGSSYELSHCLKKKEALLLDRIDAVRLIFAFGVACFVSVYVLIRSVYSNIWYDEAYTYLYYVIPIIDSNFGLDTILGFWNNSLANNHWLLTILIAVLTRITDIRYEEIIIRMPSVIFGIFYIWSVAFLYFRKKLNIAVFVALTCCSYFVEFMRQARGYAMAAVLIFWGMLLFEKWKKSDYMQGRWLVLSFGLFIISAYANSVTLIILFVYVLIGFFRMFQKKMIPSILKRWFWVLPFYGIALYVIIKYHFMITNIDAGKPLFKSNDTSIAFVFEQYLGWITTQRIAKVGSIVLPVIIFFCISYCLIKHKKVDSNNGIALIIYIAILAIMDIVFKRGGLLARTLIPGYPVFIMGIYELANECFIRVDKKNKQLILKKASVAVSFMMAIYFMIIFLDTVI